MMRAGADNLSAFCGCDLLKLSLQGFCVVGADRRRWQQRRPPRGSRCGAGQSVESSKGKGICKPSSVGEESG